MNVTKLQEIYDAALEVPDKPRRRAMLDTACAGDADLRARVDELLAMQPAAEDFFANCATAITAIEAAPDLLDDLRTAGPGGEPGDLAGSWIGPYKLLQLIGEGGCGAVYLAEQEKPVRRKVALKVIKLGMDTKSVIARFEAERQALALMEHPNIAHVLDAGATETGRPYFVMELVSGVRITEYCDQNSLNTRERLELFIQVCHAIQHAHQKGIIHRDIKPSNILVTKFDGVPLPKVIDFGIAKAIEEKPTDHTMLTMAGHFIGTPTYMSPEQAQVSGLDVDTRSDIYSLGVLLYELLTSKTPFDQKELLSSGLDELRRTLLERDPHRPSTKLDTLPNAELTMTAQHRHIEPPKLRSELQGDLDWIVMKALEKERNRRYQTANGLASDVQRYLHNEPIQARSPSRLYRFQKLVRRNKIIFAASGVATVALLAGFGTSTYMYLRERESRRIADRALANEAMLRHEAEAQASITQAAILISRDRFSEANGLVEGIDLPVMKPSLEASGVFRSLADWSVSNGRWKDAAHHLLNLVRANRIDKTDMTDAATRELLKVGPVLVLLGKTNEYQRFFNETIHTFSGTTNPIAAEQVLKISTILPADQNTVAALTPLAKVAEDSFANIPSGSEAGRHLMAWRAFALGRFEYREGNWTNAITWARRSLAYPECRPSCMAMSHAILALSSHQLRQPQEARSELSIVRDIVAGAPVPNRFDAGMALGNDTRGFWHDWMEALLLLNEAASAIEGTAPAPLLASPD